MLQTLRNEKDFMLRRELSYVETFDANIGKFNDKLRSSSLDADTQNKIAELITQYQKDFKSNNKTARFDRERWHYGASCRGQPTN